MFISTIKKIIFLIVLFVMGNNSLYSQDMVWNVQEKGRYEIGYQSFWEIDYSRLFIHDNDTTYRPLLVNIWYPAKSDSSIECMSYTDYFQIQSSSYDLKELSEKYREYNLSIVAYELLGKSKKDFTSNDQLVFDEFLHRKIPVKKKATPINTAKFPLIIYHQGFGASIEDNSVLAQLLASHGYIVIGSSFFKENGQSLGIDGRNQSETDIYYLINYASKLPNVNINNIALIGHSGGAQASFLAKSSTKNLIKAVIGIETTQEIFGISDTRWNDFTKPVIENAANMNGSILAITEHKAVFQLYDLISNTDRYYITFPETLNHNEYISQGIIAKYLKHELTTLKNDHLNDTKLNTEDLSNYAKVNDYILKFLEWKLKNKVSYKIWFHDTKYDLSIDYSKPIVTHTPLNSLGAKQYTFNHQEPLSPRQVWKMARANNIDSLIYALNYFIEIDEENPIYSDLFAFALISELVEEDNLSSSKQLFNFYKSKNIPIVNRFISLSNFSLMMGKNQYARRCLTNLLKIDPNNIKAVREIEKIEN